MMAELPEGGGGGGAGVKPRNIKKVKITYLKVKKRPVPWLEVLLPKSAIKAFHIVPLANPLRRKKVSMNIAVFLNLKKDSVI